MKTITMWNVPVPVAKLAAKAMREQVGKMIVEGAEMSLVSSMVYTIEQMEDDIKKEEEDETPVE